MFDVGYYSRKYERHGATTGALGWGGEESQRKRFQIVSECLGTAPNASVIDAGCGFGDFLEMGPFGSYVGVDPLPHMVEEARRRHPEHEFRCCEIAEYDGKADYVVASGLFGDVVSVQNWIETVGEMWRRCRVATVFNMLSSWHVSGPRRFDPLEVAAECLQFTHRIVLRVDYMPNDFTLYLLRYT